MTPADPSVNGGDDGDETSDGSSAGSFLRQVAFVPHVEPPRVERERTGEQLGRFQLTELLGSGGMGVVYAALDLTLKRKVALKLLRAEAVESEERRRRFVREARAAASVSHPNIAIVFETGEVAGHLFIAMELVQGRSLRAALQAAGGALPEAEATRIARDIARGLAAAHDAGVIHRDIKPENVMLDGNGQVKILDFGLAKLGVAAGASHDAAMTRTTHDGRILGTPSYMSPEQARGLPADARSDVFALGVVLFEMLAGYRPFGGATAMDVLAAIVRDEPPRLDLRGTGVSEAVASVVSRSLAKDPGQRYQHAGALLAALSAAASPPASTLVRRWRRYRWHAVGISAAVTVTVAWWLAFRGPEQAPRRPAADVPAPAPRPMAITDHEPPASRSPEAVTAYQAGLQAFRDANWGLAQISMREAVRLDPSLAAAHLRLAISVSAPGGVILSPSPEAHAAYRQAMRLRSALTPRDRALLAALEPILRSESPDMPETARRLDALTAQYPHDAEIFLLLAVYSMLDTPPEQRLAAAQRAVELDPAYADAWQMVGDVLRAKDPDAALAAYEHCTAVVPTAVDCWEMRASIESARGRCAEAETLLRRATSEPGTSVHRFRMRAYMLYALGKSSEAVEEVLQQVWMRLPRDRAREDEIWERAILAAAYGDFDTARKYAAEGLTLMDGRPALMDHARFTLLLTEIELETGRAAEASALASSFLRRRDGWQLARLTEDPTVYMARIVARSGAVSEIELRARRDAWYREAAPSTGTERTWAWALAYVRGIERRDEAAEALAARPESANLSGANYWLDGDNGHAFFLAGKLDEALPYLSRAFTRCDHFGYIFFTMRVSLTFGRALEQQGERGRACEVYRTILTRWGNARPRSVTAGEARKRSLALGCEAASK